MQDRYVGDVNDFFKYVVLRRLADLGGKRLGVNWYWTDPAVVDHDNQQDDGGDITYLTNGNNWRQQFDEPLFQNLQALLVVNGVVDEELRTVANIEASGILPGNTLFHIAEVPEEINDREHWHNDAMGALDDAELVFLDPNNSVCDINQVVGVHHARYATPEEVIDHLGGGHSLLYISFPPRVNRHEHHNAQTDIFVDRPPGYVLCSAYTGNCGFHLICPPEDNTPGILQALITEGNNLPDGTFRYFDTTGVEINSDAQPLDAPNGLQNDGADHIPPLDEVEDIQDHHNMSAFAQAMFDQLQQPDGDTRFRLRIVDGPENQASCRAFLSLRPEEESLIRDCLGDRQEPRVLDIGCGIGRHSIFSRALSPHARISIVEIDQSLRDYCIAEVPGAVCYEQFAHVPADASFDAVFLMGNGLGVFGNEANTCEQLQRLHSLVADGGCVLIECGNPFRGDFYAPQHVIEYNDSVDGPFTWGYATCEWLQRELVRVGFEIVTVKPSILGGPFFICHAKKCAIP